MIEYLIFVPFGYLLGSVPFGLIAGRVFRGVDIRDFGSGKTGMTNVMRTLGLPAAVLVLVMDMGKSIGAIVAADAFSDSAGVEVGAALAAMAGHIWPVFAGFRGGRGTAPVWGGMIIISPVAVAVATVTGALVLAMSRYVSLGSMVATGSAAIALIVVASLGWAPSEYMFYGIIGSPIVIISHRDNIERLLAGQERKIGERDEDGADPGARAESGKGLRWPFSA